MKTNQNKGLIYKSKDDTVFAIYSVLAELESKIPGMDYVVAEAKFLRMSSTLEEAKKDLRRFKKIFSMR